MMELIGTMGDDELHADTKHRVTMVGKAGNDLIFGGFGHDVIHGNGGADEIIAWGGNDRVFGGRGADHISGGGGADKLHGGKGRDIFVYSLSDFSSHLGGADKIDDFKPKVDGFDFTDLVNPQYDPETGIVSAEVWDVRVDLAKIGRDLDLTL